MTKLRVLLVDDEKEFVTTLADRLRMRDLNVCIAHNGEEALSVAEAENPDVVVLDRKMPGLGGMETLKLLKKSWPDLEVIILTGHGGQKDEKVALDLGAFDYLRKPADLHELLPRLKMASKQRWEKRKAAMDSSTGKQKDNQ
ncbi:MAG: response regulator [Planctomycetes bacterium]|nr:response regulator [Planctomycetota bacterium]